MTLGHPVARRIPAQGADCLPGLQLPSAAVAEGHAVARLGSLQIPVHKLLRWVSGGFLALAGLSLIPALLAAGVPPAILVGGC